MSRWKIDDAEASALISSTQGIIDDLSGIGSEIDAAVSELTGVLGSRTVIGALEDCNADFLRPMVVSSYLAGTQICTQTQKAVNAYVEGNNQMAADAQRQVDGLPEYSPTDGTAPSGAGSASSW